ncbi:MAG: MBL fold metallo-hydrolase [Chloroflexi bacterium]|nr:MBL fold metallo-hydrolase [Chloroflexota bacterium]
MTLSLEFDGGAGTVTGSRFLLDNGTARVLVDCGMFQGLKELRLRNWAPPPFDPRSIDAVILTHAHLDHTGYLPRLARLGFHGPVYCTPGAADLTRIVLLDAAHLQEEDADRANRKQYSKHHPALPLFDHRDAERALKLLKPVEFGAPLAAAAGLEARFHRSGHILGSAFVELTAASSGHRLVFSGDLGRAKMPLHPDPEPLPPCDTLVLEATYGNRTHDPRPLVHQLAHAIRPALERGGIVLIPAFAVARAQLVTWLLREAMDAHELPRVPIHVDSPMATEVTAVYGKYVGTPELDAETAPAGAHSLFPRDVHLHRTVEESKALNTLAGPRIIIAASGMLTGGRVLHHLERLGPEPANLLLLAGYQAAGTRGRALLAGSRYIRMHGHDIPVRCDFASIDGLSAHADADELVRWAAGSGGTPRNVFLVHGEDEGLSALAGRLRRPHTTVHVPRQRQRFILEEASGRWREASGHAHAGPPRPSPRGPELGRRWDNPA